MPIENKKEEVFQHPFQPNETEKEAILYVWKKFGEAKDLRNQTYKEFSDLTLAGYLDKSDAIYNALQKKISFQGRELADLQSNIPRNKISAINAKISLSIPEPEITVWGDDGVLDESNTKVLKGLNKWTEENKKTRIINIKKGNEMFVHGTVCTFTDFECLAREVKDIIKMSSFFASGSKDVKTRVITDKFGVYTRVIPLQEIFLASFYINDIQEQPYVIWRRSFNEGNFKATFNDVNNYKNVDKVVAGTNYDIEGITEFSKENQETVSNSKDVQVIKLFDKNNDRIITLANGVNIQDIPFPWHHKQYPFGWAINDFFSNVDFAYGMSVPHKLSWDVEGIEFLTNAMFEQAKIIVNPPLINYGMTEFENDVLYAGRVIKSEGQQGDLQTLQYPPLDQSLFQLISLFQSNAERASVDDLSQGVSTGGRGITARRDVMAQQNSREMLSISFTMLLELQRQETIIQLADICQYYTKKVSSVIIGKDGEEIITEVYKNFKILDTEIGQIRSDGKVKGRIKGVLEIDIDDKEKDRKEMDMKEDRAYAAGIQLEVLSPSPKVIRNLKYTIRIPYPDDFTASKDQKFARLVNSVGLAFQYAPEIVKKEEVIKELFKLTVDSPERFLLDQEDLNQTAMKRDTQGSLAPTNVERGARLAENVNLGSNFGG